MTVAEFLADKFQNRGMVKDAFVEVARLYEGRNQHSGNANPERLKTRIGSPRRRVCRNVRWTNMIEYRTMLVVGGNPNQILPERPIRRHRFEYIFQKALSAP